MSPEAQSLLKEWSPPFGLIIAIFLVSSFYFRGWLSLHRSSPQLLPVSRLAAFLAGMFFLWFAIGSPLSAFDEASLTVHMIQHILLMLVIPPLVLLGAPSLPFLHGLPQWFVRSALGPFLRRPMLQSLGRFLTHPVVCWILTVVALIAWHIPSAFELALRSDFWHEIEHTCFLGTSILFWWPVVQPYPSEPRWPRWSIPAYLFFGMLPGSVLGAFLAFCDRVLYPSYSQTTVFFGINPLSDQIVAGTLMWVFGMFIFLVPAVAITFKLLSPRLVLPGIPLRGGHEVRPQKSFQPKTFSQL
jgi:putative membrane protein